ncbi:MULTISPECIES: MFS transporter [unclassified Streptomyces]|uniref:MFS transporter n=1 Tax=unclassified Streptomyces TaxID=2593676 RepID=UPI0006F8B6E8|nr:MULTISPECIES: MFS transporter [unclassified Streptomyces]KQX52110.1 MFS transporter [Streptomyces sp. Root1304]KRA86257.1 MFS transporter [Streptomyces sp. Root66D1]
MLSVLRNRTYRHLFTAQVVALVGTGLATVALSLLAYDIAGGNASAVLGTALAIKMVAYVGIAPLISAFADRIPRRALLVTMDLTRAGVALALPFVTQVWQVYALIFLLQAASAVFTPTFQATIPEVLPDEDEYTRALSLSRLAYDLESLFSPVLAAALLSLISYNWLFTGTAAGFLASGALVVSVLLPKPQLVERTGGTYAKAAFGTRLFLATPRLRALLALDLVAAAVGAMVLVNTVVLVRDTLGRSAGDVSLTLAAYGAGSMVVALLLPRVVGHLGDRTLMLPAAFVMTATLGLLAAGLGAGGLSWPVLLAAWLVIGAATSAILTPGGRLLRRSAAAPDLPAAFAAQFSLTHACWLITYPLAGWLASQAGLTVSAAVLTALALAAAVTAVRLWPREDPAELEHVHTELPPDHPHLAGAGGRSHRHDFHIDALHQRWPVQEAAQEKTAA